MSPRRLGAVLVSGVLALATMFLGNTPTNAAFMASTLTAGQFAAASNFGTGALLSWGSGDRAQILPARIGAATGWGTGSLGAGYDCEVRSGGAAAGTLWC